MREFLLFLTTLAFLFGGSARGQSAAQPPSGSNWQRVQALPLGTSLHVRAKNHTAQCKLKAADADTLSCSDSKNTVFQRSEIKSVKIARRGRSTWVGAAIGFGAGAIVGAATVGPGCSKSSFCIVSISRGEAAVIVGTVFGVIGTPVGYFTDFTRSTIYKAPAQP